ncbi:hypothetical protein EYF80_003045 [Liparis tanakae]|uniref:Uncharacterized protein n=1 Tax=Liparis tanakae TaxID=230148 RepID=A0A4Z2JC24_9TELE|nr:hypothetical protein EYF80_003045 [Liparis tanakae]
MAVLVNLCRSVDSGGSSDRCLCGRIGCCFFRSTSSRFFSCSIVMTSVKARFDLTSERSWSYAEDRAYDQKLCYQTEVEGVQWKRTVTVTSRCPVLMGVVSSHLPQPLLEKSSIFEPTSSPNPPSPPDLFVAAVVVLDRPWSTFLLRGRSTSSMQRHAEPECCERSVRTFPWTRVSRVWWPVAHTRYQGP